MYDFQIFGYYAPAIAATFFPNSNPFASLMLTLATFGAGFLMRPLGAVILGAYIDHHGRRAGLLLTLGLMGIGTLSIACLPGYATLGIAAPLLVLAGRSAAGILRRRGTRRRLRLSFRDRAARAQRLLRELAIRQPAGRGDVRRGTRNRPHHVAFPGSNDAVGMAYRAARGMHVTALPLHHAALARGDAGVSGAARHARPLRRSCVRSSATGAWSRSA